MNVKAKIDIIRNKLLAIIEREEQLIRDVTWWNQNRLDAEPMDCGRDRMVLLKAREVLAAIDAADFMGAGRLTLDLGSFAIRAAFPDLEYEGNTNDGVHTDAGRGDADLEPG